MVIISGGNVCMPWSVAGQWLDPTNKLLAGMCKFDTEDIHTKIIATDTVLDMNLGTHD